MTAPELVIFDFDGTLAEQRGSWGLLYRLFGTEHAGNERTDAYWNDEVTFAEWCNQNVADLRAQGVTQTHIRKAADAIKLTEGVSETLSRLNNTDMPFGVVSSGVSNLMRVLDPYGPEFLISNTIVFDNRGVPISADTAVGPSDKGNILTRICEQKNIDPDKIIYIGDSHSDTEAFEIAGTAVLFDPDDRISTMDRTLAQETIYERDMKNILPFVFTALSS